MGQYKQFEHILTTFFFRTKNCNKDIHIAGDFNLNLLDHDTNKKLQDFLNLVYQNDLIPTNKPTRVTMKTATAVDHILTNYYVDNDFKSGIFKTDIYENFPVCLLLPLLPLANSENETTFIYKRTFSSDSVEMFKQKLYEINWEEVETNQSPNEAYKFFLEKTQSLYNHSFLEKKIFQKKT